MHIGPCPKPIRVYSFDKEDPFHELRDCFQLQYIRSYLSDLRAQTVIEEPYYFDRDYLSEFSTFYSISTRNYPNYCRRLHFFSDKFTKQVLENAAGGTKSSFARLKKSFLGFAVIRPIPEAPLGRTVLLWYPERMKATPRITSPSRDYDTHIAGLELSVHGLAWQQQDTGVGACATIGLWTIFHSSAFDDHHSIPTTSEITRSAHKQVSFGNRVFPSVGLTIHQIGEAIKAQKLAPLMCDGDVLNGGSVVGFTKERFASSCAAFIRSGYPVLLCGRRGNGKHAICAVGFRSCAQSLLRKGTIGLQDAEIEHLYVHDDNIGPNIRFQILEVNSGGKKVVALKPDEPKPLHPNSTYPRPDVAKVQDYIPECMLVAVHEDLRTSPDALHKAGLRLASILSTLLSAISSATKITIGGLTVSTRFIRSSEYLSDEMSRVLGRDKKLLSRVRLELREKVCPMSLHLGVVRIALDDSTPLVDVIYDTTDSDRNHPIFAHVDYAPMSSNLMNKIMKAGVLGDFGTTIEAY